MEKDLFAIRKQKVYEFICSDLYVPMKIKQLVVMLEVKAEDRPQLERILEELQQEGKIVLSKRGRYTKAQICQLTGQFSAMPKGYGFVSVEGEEDIFIPETKVNGALHLDTVEVSVSPILSEGRHREGEVLRILERGFKEIVCTYEQSRGCGFGVPDNVKFGRDILIPAEFSKGAVSGHKVVVEITDYGTGSKDLRGKVVEILGHANDPGVDILSLVRAYGLTAEFSKEVLNQVEQVAKADMEESFSGRLDLRDWDMVTIDGEDAKDLDDAVSLSVEGENYILGVHIADVSHYVKEHSPLDEEAKKRGTSVYLVDRVMPMLPHGLSNGICSLNAGEDRLALSCIMTLDQRGEVIDHKIAETVINVNRRLSYEGVKKLLTPEGARQEPGEGQNESTVLQNPGERQHEGKTRQADREAIQVKLEADQIDRHVAQEVLGEEPEQGKLLTMLLEMRELAAILRNKRMKRGSIDFEFPETKVRLDGEGNPIEIVPYDRNVATRMIEDFMLIANETVAEEYFWREIPFVYRTHENPDSEKVDRLSTFIRNFGYTIRMGGDELHPKEVQKLLGKIEGSGEEMLISRLTLRSMKQAKYTVECTGHFGLAARYYCHFTSPIRRYPDLQIHRIIKENLSGRMNEKRQQHYARILPEVAKHSSAMERRADEAERETVKLKKAVYMERFVGTDAVFSGVISGVTEWGFYVELENTVEGLVRAAYLQDDFYRYCEETYELVGSATGKSYKLGQRVQVKVTGADRALRTVDFVLAGE